MEDREEFLSVAAQSDALLHVVDASGSVDKDGKIADPGTGDPLADLADVELVGKRDFIYDQRLA